MSVKNRLKYNTKNIFRYVILWCTLNAYLTIAFASQKVIVAVIDGARYTETFGAGETYIPNMWNDMKPFGTIYEEFYNFGKTETSPGHASIVTGTWQTIPDGTGDRPTKPTVFEYYRKQLGSLESDNYVIAGKSKLFILTYSTHSDYGSVYQAANETYDADDQDTYDRLMWVMDTHHPDLIIVNFPEVDWGGHSGDWDYYTSSLSNADALMYSLWQKIQTDNNYKDNTTLFITNDHGRHSDGVLDGFQGHGDDCEGCQHIMLLAIGKGVTPGQIISETRDMRDIAPTIGDLLGFATPLADGISLYEGDTSLPVSLSSFTASAGHYEVNLSWTTESELNNIGFNIWRSFMIHGDYFKINPNLIPGEGNSSHSHNYRFTDRDVINGMTYYYQLEDFAFDGSSKMNGPIEINLENKESQQFRDGVSTFLLYQNIPNPFNSRTNIKFHLPKASHVKIIIYDNAGRKITELVNVFYNSGSWQVEWQNLTEASGIYFCRMEANGFSDVRKMILIR
jgi:hypothetical protein